MQIIAGSINPTLLTPHSSLHTSHSKKMRTFLRFLERNKLYTFINVFGLSISLAFVVLIAIFTERQMNTDSFQEKADRIFLFSAMKSQYNNAYWLPRYLSERYPEIESGISMTGEKFSIEVDKETTNETVLIADSAFFKMFTTETVDGDVNQFMMSDRNCVISQSYARKMFGDRSAVGKTLNINDETHTVVAVIKNIENSVLPDASVIFRAEMMTRYNPSNNPDMSNAGSCYTFLLLKENADLSPKFADIRKYLNEIYWIVQYYPEDTDIQLHPLRSLYFDEKWGSLGCNKGDSEMMHVLDIVALVLLFFAILNYVNLTTAQATFRAKEMATRQLLGTKRGAVMLRLIGETVMLCAVSFVLSVVLAELIAPHASELVDYPLSVMRNITPVFIGIFVAAILIIGTLSGLLPAIVISGYKPLDVMRGELRSRVKGFYGLLMIGLQYTIVCVMLIGSLMFYRQIRGMMEAPLGYNTQDMILLSTYMPVEKSIVIKDKLMQEAWVDKVGFTQGHPHEMLNNNTMQKEDGTALPFRLLVCDSTAFDILGIKKLHDNHVAVPDDEKKYTMTGYFTKSTYAMMGIDENSTQPVIMKNGTHLISKGTFADIHYGSILQSWQPPIMVKYFDIKKDQPWTMLIKTNGDHAENMRRLEKIYSEVIPDMPFDEQARYVDNIISDSYEHHRKVLTIVFVFTLVSILVSSLGLLAMSTIYIRQRRRSIAVKRIFGIHPRQIIVTLLRPFVVVVLLSFAVACPLAYKLIVWWLQDYAYRVPQAWWIYLIVGFVAVLLAVLTIIGLAMNAARSNPLKCLREV